MLGFVCVKAEKKIIRFIKGFFLAVMLHNKFHLSFHGRCQFARNLSNEDIQSPQRTTRR